jgi:hypothetical protein
MKREFMAGLGMLLAATSLSYAQSTATVPVHPDAKAVPADSTMKSATPGTQAAGTQAAGTSVRQQLSDNLKKAGYTDVKMRPDAYIVEAKNKSGEPVMMFLSPDSMTIFTAIDPKGAETKAAVTAAR